MEKPGLLEALGKPKSEPGPLLDDGDEGMAVEGKQAALRAAFDAMKSDDFDTFADAMSDYVEMCMNA